MKKKKLFRVLSWISGILCGLTGLGYYVTAKLIPEIPKIWAYNETWFIIYAVLSSGWLFCITFFLTGYLSHLAYRD